MTNIFRVHGRLLPVSSLGNSRYNKLVCLVLAQMEPDSLFRNLHKLHRAFLVVVYRNP